MKKLIEIKYTKRGIPVSTGIYIKDKKDFMKAIEGIKLEGADFFYFAETFLFNAKEAREALMTEITKDYCKGIG